MGNTFVDLIIRIKNGYLAKKEKIIAKYSKFNIAILEKLKKIGFIADFKVTGEVKKEIQISLIYKEGMPVFTDVKIFSKPGQKHYVSYRDLKPVLNGLGYSIISTPKGILTDKEAKKLKVGGELLFNIW